MRKLVHFASGTARESSTWGMYAMAGDNCENLHHEILELRLDNVREDQYPSVTQFNVLEETPWEEEVAPYAETLMDKVRQDTYPSIDQLRRLQRLA